MHRAIASLSALVALLLPSAAWACPVCGQGAPGTESALLVMSGILSALPLLMAGGIVAWVVVRSRSAAEAAEAVEEESVAPHRLAHPNRPDGGR